ncbi:hypothetical protein ACX3VG_12530 [Escherichia coli]
MSVLSNLIASRHSLSLIPVSYTHLRAHETRRHRVCRLLLEKDAIFIARNALCRATSIDFSRER